MGNFIKGSDSLARTTKNIKDPTSRSAVPTAVSSFENDSGYITDYTVTESDVTAHEAALTITESQISDLTHYADSDVVSLMSNFGSNVIVTTGNITGNTAGYPIGYRDIPLITMSGNVTIAVGDGGKTYYSTSATDYTLTVANNSSQAFTVGTAINLINRGTGNINITPDSGVTMYTAGNTVSSSRVLTSYGAGTLQKVEGDIWFLVGVGIV